MLNSPGEDFSFSGLKTAVRYYLRDHPTLVKELGAVRDLCASVQAAIVDVLVGKTIRAARRLGVQCVTASGGVTCNRWLRAELTAACARHGLTLRLADRALCTDNAAMIGLLAELRFARTRAASGWDAEVKPGWELQAV